MTEEQNTQENEEVVENTSPAPEPVVEKPSKKKATSGFNKGDRVRVNRDVPTYKRLIGTVEGLAGTETVVVRLDLSRYPRALAFDSTELHKL